ncbi:hypothetical protein SAMN05660420_03373 [Desulfuromusa kysingii]|uniref:Uncharacterized protein n=1 Tax=Desulfuromusa kysingii TaxID=37625 RepID=A0A1H4EGD3_9BACT|nr:hypothetical protein [Desulfuromusa kysingii]SEA84124.1 hypothetical protein SAMN05660420_03373 [Desulfuromusa kysingii]
MKSLPSPEIDEDVTRFTDRVMQTYGAVKSMRSSFRTFFESFSKSNIDEYQLNPAQRALFEQCKSNDVKIQQFSDCIAIFLPLRDDINKLPMRGVFGVLAAAATTFLSCLAYGQPIRGGIDIGVALEIDQNEIYGPALSRAYSLESSVAQYPRVVIGDELFKYLKLHANQEEKTIFSKISKESARSCLELLSIDDDGYPYIDYLGKSFKEDMAATDSVEIIIKAYDFVLSESKKHQSEKNPKLAFKYTPLRSYFENRMGIWNENNDQEI